MEYTMDIGGAIVSPHDPNDYIYENLLECLATSDEAMPEKLDLRIYQSRAQNGRGTCAAFAAAIIKEIHEHNLDPTFDARLSPEFVYYHRINKPTSGMYGRDVVKILKKQGISPEDLYPYLQADGLAKKPSDAVSKKAKKMKIANYARVSSCSGLKTALWYVGPCYMQLPFYNKSACFWKAEEIDTFDIPPEKNNTRGRTLSSSSPATVCRRPASPSTQKCYGCHAVAVVGYDETGFILQNSWGPTWNGDGCTIFPYTDWDICEKYGECWVPVNRN